MELRDDELAIRAAAVSQSLRQQCDCGRVRDSTPGCAIVEKTVGYDNLADESRPLISTRRITCGIVRFKSFRKCVRVFRVFRCVGFMCLCGDIVTVHG